MRNPVEQLSLAIEIARREIRALREIRKLERRGLHVGSSLVLRPSATTRFSFGSGCAVEHGTLLMTADSELTLGDGVVIGEYCNIRSAESFVRLGSRTQLAQFVSLIAVNHEVDERGLPQRGTDLRDGRHGITIGEDCWLGTQTVVLPGVTLGDRCIVAAGAVVRRGSYPAGSRLGGVPAKQLT